MTIAQNLKALRKKSGLSQVQLAEKSAVSQQLISQIENGVNTTTKALPALAKALGCHVSEIDPAYTEQPTGSALDKYQMLTPEGQAAVDAMILALYAQRRANDE